MTWWNVAKIAWAVVISINILTVSFAESDSPLHKAAGGALILNSALYVVISLISEAMA